ncbi:hypothetical protein PACILC2_48400 [Paenibacillus cisolokensis]|uniref:N-acetyltransferase domain-containing protein n=1 Tax=Paenibacillus cisolokensis TaxID=1658519 RepID=A0ABQ4NDF4_9BACL|nr:N-acetyltransferase [Paenibacillus cisolokensis]GIQ66272.1 hypothetical protein PACILC2_48400 [Paenibacillus cisolokensis]
MIRLRQPRSDDKEIMRLIRSELIPYSHTAQTDVALTMRELPKRLRQGVTFVAVRRRSDPLIGFLHVVVLGNVLYIDMLAVHPNHRGSGWGKRLMEYGEAYGISQQCSTARLVVDESNPGAQRFYCRIGYRVGGYDPHIRCRNMFKPLNAKPFPGQETRGGGGASNSDPAG